MFRMTGELIQSRPLIIIDDGYFDDPARCLRRRKQVNARLCANAFIFPDPDDVELRNFYYVPPVRNATSLLSCLGNAEVPHRQYKK